LTWQRRSVAEVRPSVAALNAPLGSNHHVKLPRSRVWWRELQRAVWPMRVVVVNEDTKDTLEVAPVHDSNSIADSDSSQTR
jgi:hypothetical protein